MTTEQLITLVTSGTGALAAFAALFTVIEMKRQRRTAYGPDLLVRGSRFQVHDSHPAGLDRYTITTGSSVPLTEQLAAQSVRCQLHNAGFGPARHIEIAWTFDLESFSELIAATLPNETVHLDRRGPWFLEIRGPRGYRVLHNTAALSRARILVIPPQTAEDLVLPSDYADILAQYLASLSLLAEMPTNMPEVLPSITLQLTFEDLDGKRHARKFGLIPRLSGLHRPSPKGSPIYYPAATGVLEVGEA